MSLDSICDVSIGNIDTILINLREQVYHHFLLALTEGADVMTKSRSQLLQRSCFALSGCHL